MEVRYRIRCAGSFVALCAALLLSVCVVPPAHAQPTPTEVAKLVGSNSTTRSGFGTAAAIDGDTAVIGEWIFGQPPVPDFEAYVFERIGGVWTQQQRFSLPGVADFFGVRVAVSGDTFIVSGLGNAGEVLVYTRTGAVWTQQQTLIPADAGIGVNKNFGISVALAGDTAVIGAASDDHAGIGSGAAYVFARAGGVWSQQAKLTASDAGVRDFFGSSVAVSGDTVVVGANHFLKPGTGAAYVFARSGGSWTQQAKLTASDGALDDVFGVSVAVSGDTALIGAGGDDDAGDGSGSAYVYARSGGSWVEQAKLTASDAAAGDSFGINVAVSGNTALIGAPGDDGIGSAYLFTRNGSAWTEQAKLRSSDAAAMDSFGLPVAIDGDTALVGASGNDDQGDASGSAYVFSLGVDLIDDQGDASGSAYVFSLGVDPDGDNYPDDNCPTVSNPSQADVNGDGYGDACVPQSSTVSQSATIGPGLVMGDRSRILGAAQIGGDLNLGSRSNILGPNTIGDDVTIGNLVTILPGVFLGNDVEVGNRVVVLANADIADGVTIGDGVIVGLQSFIGADSIVGNNVRIGLRSSVGTSVTIGSNVSIGVFAQIGDGARIGDNVSIGPGARIAPGAVVPAGTRIRPGASFP
jgi:acetyltransferase-like isoleucine patch superfamily enzyme